MELSALMGSIRTSASALLVLPMTIAAVPSISAVSTRAMAETAGLFATSSVVITRAPVVLVSLEPTVKLEELRLLATALLQR
jgi:hypothetical protein